MNWDRVGGQALREIDEPYTGMQMLQVLLCIYKLEGKRERQCLMEFWECAERGHGHWGCEERGADSAGHWGVERGTVPTSGHWGWCTVKACRIIH